MRERIFRLLTNVLYECREEKIESFEIYPMHNIHAYIRPRMASDVSVHLQGYPGLSTEREAVVAGRILNYRLMMDARKIDANIIGNEHSATITWIPNLETTDRIPYDAKALLEIVKKAVPELG